MPGLPSPLGPLSLCAGEGEAINVSLSPAAGREVRGEGAVSEVLQCRK
jgi:hypothetical protein